MGFLKSLFGFLPDDINDNLQAEVERWTREKAIKDAEKKAKEAEHEFFMRHCEEMNRKMKLEAFTTCQSNLSYLKEILTREPLCSFLRLKDGFRLTNHIELTCRGVFQYPNPGSYDGGIVVDSGTNEIEEVTNHSLEKDMYSEHYPGYISELAALTPEKIAEIFRAHFRLQAEGEDFLRQFFG